MYKKLSFRSHVVFCFNNLAVEVWADEPYFLSSLDELPLFTPNYELFPSFKIRQKALAIPRNNFL
jgi:hypothetical protein